ncbi:MAG: hypothetical protein WBP72_05730 [Rhodocyclaceae bacterium]
MLSNTFNVRYCADAAAKLSAPLVEHPRLASLRIGGEPPPSGLIEEVDYRDAAARGAVEHALIPAEQAAFLRALGRQAMAENRTLTVEENLSTVWIETSADCRTSPRRTSGGGAPPSISVTERQ